MVVTCTFFYRLHLFTLDLVSLQLILVSATVMGHHLVEVSISNKRVESMNIHAQRARVKSTARNVDLDLDNKLRSDNVNDANVDEFSIAFDLLILFF